MPELCIVPSPRALLLLLSVLLIPAAAARAQVPVAVPAAVPVPAAAAPTPVASDITRSCAAGSGCVLTCLNMAAETVMTETATRAVRIISLSNGNSEFRMDNGNAGINVILVSHDNLMCKLSGGI
ncbi:MULTISPECIES: hypothetical protein [Herbaspirillum]|jgi:hypothetical protein|uniref:Uncharacterized protein n=1 Tax=Herbaspirillum aquaticum TaxID=568783 RepID=A0A225SXI3_9BURK|nr:MULTISPECIES: hypothetical protein [Herbaspirillum]MBW9336821.1 hypothetical protein [Herbaspirillum sp. RU 5E]MRT32203.1 hypothetical protein [Herbaspirillum sp. CAH-3]OWY35694.1 hypothetical protein CEJ45_04605 [Herbaspirillum aquaticum]